MDKATAWFADGSGGLRWREEALPALRSRDLLIEVRAAGVNRPDLLQRQGLYPPPPGASEALGLEVAGIVEAVGSDVRRFQPGDRVMALVPGGAYAERCVAPEGSAMPLPSTWQFVQGAAFPETGFTVWANVFDGAHVAGGQAIFVHGATSGIGTMAASIAQALGHPIFGTAGTTEKAQKAEGLGYQKVWNYNVEDWSGGMKTLGGADLVLDMVGGDYVEKNLALLNDGGRHVSIAFQGGIHATVNIMDLMRRRLTLTGSTLRARSESEKARLRADIEAKLFPLIDVGQLAPHVSLEVDMAQVDLAHDAMRSGNLIGKAVLTR